MLLLMQGLTRLLQGAAATQPLSDGTEPLTQQEATPYCLSCAGAGISRELLPACSSTLPTSNPRVHQHDIHPHCRYSEIKERLTPFLRGCGYNPKKDLVFLPISGLLGHNIQKPVDKSMCSWYSVSSTYLYDNVLGRLQAAWCMQPVAGRWECAPLPCAAHCNGTLEGCMDVQRLAVVHGVVGRQFVELATLRAFRVC